jgi:hypothetical protein
MGQNISLGLDTTEAAREPILVHCGACGHEWSLGFTPMPIDTFVKVGKSKCPACRKKPVYMGAKPRPTADGDAIGWLTNCDTGISSKTIWSVMMCRSVGRTDVPLDPADFGRCYRLLQIMPSWRARLPEVAAKYPEWAPLVGRWDDIERLYLEELSSGMARKCYALMRELRDTVGR